MQFVLLPGLDGTGRLLAAFARALGPAGRARAVAYPPDVELSYEDLAGRVRRELPRGPFVLVGESFGGPLAVMVAASGPPGLAGVVLCATFARPPVAVPSPLAALARFVLVRGAPKALVARALLGRSATPALRDELAAAIAAVSPVVLRARLGAIVRVDVRPMLARVAVPLLYLRASRDRVVLRASGDAILRAAPRTTIVEIDGPHLLLQAAPDACATAVLRWAEGLSSAPRRE